MAVLNKRAIVTAIEMYGVTAIRLGRTLNPALDVLIKALFANNEQGFAYDPNDLTTLYQDAAGTIPVKAAGQTVGLMLDKKTLLQESAELNPDTHFKDSAKWLLNRASIADEKLIFTDAPSASNASILGLTELGKWYKITVTVDSISGQLRVSPYLPGYTPTINFDINAAGTYTAIMQAEAAASPGILVRTVGASTSAIVSFLSIKELSGNHAYQSVSAMRPLLVAAPQRLDYDAVDDKLITNLPTQLTGCTVVRSVPNVGTQILTNQTIPTPYNGNIDNCGLIVINRALTASETSQLTKLFNKAAGV